jgi:hypothetical protein
MPLFLVEANKVIKYRNKIEADTLEEAEAVVDEMIVDDFTAVNTVFTVECVMELANDK